MATNVSGFLTSSPSATSPSRIIASLKNLPVAMIVRPSISTDGTNAVFPLTRISANLAGSVKEFSIKNFAGDEVTSHYFLEQVRDCLRRLLLFNCDRARKIISPLRTDAAQPLLEHDEAEEQFMIVLPPRAMIVQKPAHRLRVQLLKHERTFVQQQFRKISLRARIEPVVHDVDREAAFFAQQNLRRKKFETHATVQPFADAGADFVIGVQPLRVFDDIAVQIRHTRFKAVRHRKFVGIYEQFVRQRRADFQKLKAAEFVRLFQLRKQRLQIRGQFTVAVRGKLLAEKSADAFRRM